MFGGGGVRVVKDRLSFILGKVTEAEADVKGIPASSPIRHGWHLFIPSAFSVAFLFNWIGFFLSFCLTTSAAGRYGAISGFGLSLIKWILIVRVSCTSGKIDSAERQ